VIGGPSPQTVAVFETRLERQRRLAGLRLDALVMSITGMDDLDGWQRLNALGLATITATQTDAIDTTAEYLIGTLADNRIPGNDVVVPIRPGVLQSGQSVARFLLATRDAVGSRMNAGDPFPVALQGSRNVVVGVGASEPHRIGRQGSYLTGATDSRFSRWQRVTVGDTCAWCRMAASRGAVYYTKSSAQSVTPAKGHPHCDCRMVEIVGEDAIEESRARGALDWARQRADGTAWTPPATSTARGASRPAPVQLAPLDRAKSVAQQLKVLRRQIGDGTATQWTRDRIAVLEAEAA
jgi:hypothetical protein